MNYLGIDYGEKRVGLAKAESGTKIATPLGTFMNTANLFDQLVQIVRSESIDKIVVGLPVSFDGRENRFVRVIRAFAQKLTTLSARPVEFVNEVFSSKIAVRNSSKVDESSAALILQSFLDGEG